MNRMTNITTIAVAATISSIREYLSIFFGFPKLQVDMHEKGIPDPRALTSKNVKAESHTSLQVGNPCPSCSDSWLGGGAGAPHSIS
jgi:hypothetical protein